MGVAALDTEHVGAWRSPVAYSLGVRVVGRSNRLAPTNLQPLHRFFIGCP